MRSTLLVVLALCPLVAHADDKKPPTGATKIKIDYDYASFHSNQLRYELTWTKTAYKTADKKTVIDSKLIDALYTSLTSLREVEEEVSCISHTDDYPKFTISIEGDRPVTISTSSNCHANVPWNVLQNGKHYAQFNGDIAKAVYKLLAAVDAKNWKIGPDGPDASMSFGGAEYVELGSYDPSFQRASPSAVACVKDLQTSAKVKQALGTNVTATQLELICDLARSADCTDTVAQASFPWNGVALQMEMPCVKGVISFPTATAASIAELQTMLRSKVMQTFVKMSGSAPPRMWNNGEWTLEGGMEDGPMLSFAPGTKKIHVRAVGEKGPGAAKFFKALGIDAKKIAKKVDAMFYETEIDVDFDGHVVK